MKESEDTDATEKGCILVWRRAPKHLREMQPGDKSGEGALGAKVVGNALREGGEKVPGFRATQEGSGFLCNLLLRGAGFSAGQGLKKLTKVWPQEFWPQKFGPINGLIGLP